MLKKKARNAKRVLVISDMHCGSGVGMVPPKYQHNETQSLLWKQYLEWLKMYPNPDICIVCGDAVDGSGDRDGGVGQITVDRYEQVLMAEEVLKATKAKSFQLVAGTPYHVSSDGEDFERILADKIGGEFSDHGFYSINGVAFDVKHKINGSAGGLPHTSYTGIAKEVSSNENWFMQGIEPKARVLIRGHRHRYGMVDTGSTLGFVCPAMQGLNSRYGSRQCSGLVHVGVLFIDVIDNNNIEYRALLSEPTIQKQIGKVL
jgi:hypothetical protein